MDLTAGEEQWSTVESYYAASADTVVLKRFTGDGYASEKVADCAYAVDGRYMTVRVKKADIGLSGDDFTVNFTYGRTTCMILPTPGRGREGPHTAAFPAIFWTFILRVTWRPEAVSNSAMSVRPITQVPAAHPTREPMRTRRGRTSGLRVKQPQQSQAGASPGLPACNGPF